MATVTIGTHTTEIPDEALAKMEASVGRFPEYHGNVAEWIADWVKGTLLSLAQQEHTANAQAAVEDARLEIASLFRKSKAP